MLYNCHTDVMLPPQGSSDYFFTQIKHAYPWSLSWLLEKLGLHSWMVGLTVPLYPSRSAP